jgi:glycosyltransferase involved in cell wall biosynthesis
LIIFEAFMISNRNILCISTPPWEAEYASTTVQLLRELAKHNKVLFVNNPFTIKDVTDGLRKRKNVPVKKVFGFKERLKKFPVGNGRDVFVLTPPMAMSIQFLPNGFLYRKFMQWNGWLVRRTVQRYLKKLNMQDDLISIVSFNPTIGLEVGRRLNEKLLLYLCYDEIAAAPHLKKHGVWQEQQFARLADAMIVTSQGLYERKKSLSEHCYIIKNAADFPLFSKGFNPEIPQKKQVGFIGAIDRRLDYPLLEYLISSLPDVAFTFIGRIRTPEGAAILKKYKNVTLIASRPLQELPMYVNQFSVGIIPFKRSEFIKTVYPLKLNEYLAAGVPVVTTNFSYLEDFRSVISIAETAEAFKACVLHEMQNDSLEKKKARQTVAQQNSWEHRAEELSQVITELEQQKALFQKPIG